MKLSTIERAIRALRIAVAIRSDENRKTLLQLHEFELQLKRWDDRLRDQTALQQAQSEDIMHLNGTIQGLYSRDKDLGSKIVSVQERMDHVESSLGMTTTMDNSPAPLIRNLQKRVECLENSKISVPPAAADTITIALGKPKKPWWLRLIGWSWLGEDDGSHLYPKEP